MCVAFLKISAKKKPDFEKARKKLRGLVKTPIGKWPTEFRESQGMFEDDAKKLNASDGGKTAETWAQLLSDDLDLLEMCFVDGGMPRQIAWIEIGKKVLLLSGGPSWGDPPTEAYDSIERLFRSGLSAAAGFDF